MSQQPGVDEEDVSTIMTPTRRRTRRTNVPFLSPPSLSPAITLHLLRTGHHPDTEITKESLASRSSRSRDDPPAPQRRSRSWLNTVLQELGRRDAAKGEDGEGEDEYTDDTDEQDDDEEMDPEEEEEEGEAQLDRQTSVQMHKGTQTPQTHTSETTSGEVRATKPRPRRRSRQAEGTTIIPPRGLPNRVQQDPFHTNPSPSSESQLQRSVHRTATKDAVGSSLGTGHVLQPHSVTHVPDHGASPAVGVSARVASRDMGTDTVSKGGGMVSTHVFDSRRTGSQGLSFSFVSAPSPRDTSHVDLAADQTPLQDTDSATDRRRRFHCTRCPKRFPNKSALTLHVRVHTGEKPFQCSACGRKFRQKSHLVGHFRLHTGEKPYKCLVCGKQYKDKSGLNGHTKSHCGKEGQAKKVERRGRRPKGTTAAGGKKAKKSKRNIGVDMANVIVQGQNTQGVEGVMSSVNKQTFSTRNTPRPPLAKLGVNGATVTKRYPS